MLSKTKVLRCRRTARRDELSARDRLRQPTDASRRGEYAIFRLWQCDNTAACVVTRSTLTWPCPMPNTACGPMTGSVSSVINLLTRPVALCPGEFSFNSIAWKTSRPYDRVAARSADLSRRGRNRRPPHGCGAPSDGTAQIGCRGNPHRKRSADDREPGRVSPLLPQRVVRGVRTATADGTLRQAQVMQAAERAVMLRQ